MEDTDFNIMTDKIRTFYKNAGFHRNVHPTQLYSVLFNVLKDGAARKYGEIGSHIGCSMSYAALINKDLEIYCYDAPNNGWGGEAGTDHYLKLAIEKFAPGRVITNFGNSHSAEIKEKIKSNGPYDVFLIDGDHSYHGAKEDFLTVWPTVKSGGVIVMDDLLWGSDELNRLFEDLVKEFNISRYEKFLTLSPFETEYNIHFRGLGVIYKD